MTTTATPTPARVVCAWCGRILGDALGCDDDTSGICALCDRDFRRQNDIPQREDYPAAVRLLGYNPDNDAADAMQLQRLLLAGVHIGVEGCATRDEALARLEQHAPVLAEFVRHEIEVME